MQRSANGSRAGLAFIEGADRATADIYIELISRSLRQYAHMAQKSKVSAMLDGVVQHLNSRSCGDLSLETEEDHTLEKDVGHSCKFSSLSRMLDVIKIGSSLRVGIRSRSRAGVSSLSSTLSEDLPIYQI